MVESGQLHAQPLRHRETIRRKQPTNMPGVPKETVWKIFLKKGKSLVPTGNRPRFLRLTARNLVTMPMALSGLPLCDAVSSKNVTYITVTKQHSWMREIQVSGTFRSN
jgi:hypothetical protein